MAAIQVDPYNPFSTILLNPKMHTTTTNNILKIDFGILRPFFSAFLRREPEVWANKASASNSFFFLSSRLLRTSYSIVTTKVIKMITSARELIAGLIPRRTFDAITVVRV